MRQALTLLLLLSLFTVFARGEADIKDFSSALGRGDQRTAETVRQADDLQYNWLYEKLFTKEVRETFPDRTFKSFQVHLRDSQNVFPDPSAISFERLKVKRSYKGSMVYVGFVRKTYFYDVLEGPDGALTFRVQVNLLNGTLAEQKSFSDKLKVAQDLWNQNVVTTNFPYRFQFEIVPKANLAHFSVWLLDSTRGPYDRFWGRNWSATTLAHEVGHMMGLGDEYQTISSEMDCYESSLMCDSGLRVPMPHHYYFILRRLVN